MVVVVYLMYALVLCVRKQLVRVATYTVSEGVRTPGMSFAARLT